MSMINVYSVCPNSAEFSIFSTNSYTDVENKRVTDTKVIKTVTIRGLNDYKKQVFKNLSVPLTVAKTEVDKSLWDEIMASRGDSDPLLVNGQVFAAKGDVEAEMIAAKACSFITDLGTQDKYAKKITDLKVW